MDKFRKWATALYSRAFFNRFANLTLAEQAMVEWVRANVPGATEWKDPVDTFIGMEAARDAFRAYMEVYGSTGHRDCPICGDDLDCQGLVAWDCPTEIAEAWLCPRCDYDFVRVYGAPRTECLYLPEPEAAPEYYRDAPLAAWATGIANRLLDEATGGHYGGEGVARLATLLRTCPDALRAMVGTEIIEEDYFDDRRHLK